MVQFKVEIPNNREQPSTHAFSNMNSTRIEKDGCRVSFSGTQLLLV